MQNKIYKNTYQQYYTTHSVTEMYKVKNNTNWTTQLTFATDFGVDEVGISRDESNGSKIINAVLTISRDSNYKIFHLLVELQLI